MTGNFCPRCGKVLMGTNLHPHAECDAIYDEVYQRTRQQRQRVQPVRVSGQSRHPFNTVSYIDFDDCGPVTVMRAVRVTEPEDDGFSLDGVSDGSVGTGTFRARN